MNRQIAEKLYQGGFLSYPRTETDQFDNQFDFQTLIEKQAVDPAWGNFATRQDIPHVDFSAIFHLIFHLGFSRAASIPHVKERTTIKHILLSTRPHMSRILRETTRKCTSTLPGDSLLHVLKMLSVIKPRSRSYAETNNSLLQVISQWYVSLYSTDVELLQG